MRRPIAAGAVRRRPALRRRAASRIFALLTAMGVVAAAAGIALAAGPEHDNSADAKTVQAIPYVDVASTQGATLEANEAQLCPGGTIGATAWYKWRPTINTGVTVETLGSNFDTILVILEDRGTVFPMIGCSQDILIANVVSSRESQVKFSAIAGHTYYFEVGGKDAQKGKLRFAINKTPANDELLDAHPLAAPAAGVTTNIGATLEAGEVPGCPGETDTLWYRFTAIVPGPYVFETTGSNFDTAVSVFEWADASGNPTGQFVREPTAFTLLGCSDDISPSKVTSSLTFNAQTGRTYFIEVGGKNGRHGLLKYMLSPVQTPWLPETLPPTQVPWPGPVQNPVPPVPEEIPPPPIPPVPPVPPIPPLPPIPPDEIPPVPPLPTLGRPVNDDLNQAALVPAAPYALVQSTINATTQSGEPLNSCANRMAATVWFTFTPLTSQSLFADTLGSTYANQIAVYAQGGNGFSGLTLIGCSGSGSLGQASFAWQGIAGTRYYIQIGGDASRSAQSGVLSFKLIRLL